MNLRSWKLRVVIVLGVLGLLAVTWAAVPQKITIEKCGEKRTAVSFDHALHVAAESDCVACHHTDEGLTVDSGTAEACRDCHLEPEEGVLGCSEMGISKNAYHVACVNCHKAALKADASVDAPTKCDDCHPKS